MKFASATNETEPETSGCERGRRAGLEASVAKDGTGLWFPEYMTTNFPSLPRVLPKRSRSAGANCTCHRETREPGLRFQRRNSFGDDAVGTEAIKRDDAAGCSRLNRDIRFGAAGLQ